MNTFRLLVVLAVLVIGLVVGALNSQLIVVNFVFSEIVTTSGVAIIISLLAGALAGGGLVLLSVVLPLYSRLRRNGKLAANSDTPPASAIRMPTDGR